jgi:sterol desaturase/sphingolipid hydroxylase (fatty acid hydroxylase superfamily)
LGDLLSHLQAELHKAAMLLLVPTPFFIVLAFATKGVRLAGDVVRALRQGWVNILMHITDYLLVVPVVVLIVAGMNAVFESYGLRVLATTHWQSLPLVVVGFAGVFLADFIGYWRHRLEHMPLLWPSHAVHHSDDAMTWLAIFRFHPFNRLSTSIIDIGFLLILGLPEYAILAAMTVRHYYGAFIHADLPWTFGRLGYVFVSPAMHRWHHAKDKVAYNTNYATVFSIFDLAFGTFRVPGACDAPLGVPDRIGTGLIGLLAHPLKPSSYRYFRSRLATWRQRKPLPQE